MNTQFRATATIALAALLSACAGVTLTPISKEDALHRHDPGGSAKGYTVYAPMLVVQIERVKKCLKTKPKSDECEGDPVLLCQIGEPKLFPDYSRPFVVDSKSGLGKAGTEIAITNGWMLSSVKDSSDNTALLAAVIGGTFAQPWIASNEKEDGCQTGVYQWSQDNKLLPVDLLSISSPARK